MQRKATTVRLEPASQAGLSKLSEILRQPVNKLVNEAVREYVARRSKQAEDELASTLEDLRALRRRDPDFELSIAKFIEAELAVKDDPAEGSVFIEEGESDEPGAIGPAQKAMLNILND
jgi:predicted transcriptional regulator